VPPFVVTWQRPPLTGAGVLTALGAATTAAAVGADEVREDGLVCWFRRRARAPEMVTRSAFEPAQTARRIDRVSAFDIAAAAARTVRRLMAVYDRSHVRIFAVFEVHISESVSTQAGGRLRNETLGNHRAEGEQRMCDRKQHG
jgi:hypothetical protein